VTQRREERERGGVAGDERGRGRPPLGKAKKSRVRVRTERENEMDSRIILKGRRRRRGKGNVCVCVNGLIPHVIATHQIFHIKTPTARRRRANTL